jgi:hypothetical protein
MVLGSTQPLVKMSTRNIPGGKGSQCVRLTTSPPSCAECHEIWEPKPPGTLWATPGLLRDDFTLLLLLLLLLLLFNVSYLFLCVPCYAVFVLCDHYDTWTALIAFLRADAKFHSIPRLLFVKVEYFSLDIFNFLHGVYFVKLFVHLRAFREVVI